MAKKPMKPLKAKTSAGMSKRERRTRLPTQVKTPMHAVAEGVTKGNPGKGENMPQEYLKDVGSTATPYEQSGDTVTTGSGK